MEDIKVTWSEKEFKAYLLIYAAQTNLHESENQVEFLESHFDKNVLIQIHNEINKDNDYIRIQKIMTYIDKQGYSSEDLENLLNVIKEVYLCDGTFDAIEKTLFNIIKKLFRT